LAGERFEIFKDAVGKFRLARAITANTNWNKKRFKRINYLERGLEYYSEALFDAVLS